MAEFFKARDGVKRTLTGKRERKTIGAVAAGLTAASYTVAASGEASEGKSFGINRREASYALVQVLTNSINFTLDGTTPTAAVGYLAAANDLIHLNSAQEIRNFQAIRNGGADGAVDVTYFFER